MSTIIGYFNDIDDPRTGNARRHKFCDIMTISLLCVLCGGETAVDMADLYRLRVIETLLKLTQWPGFCPCRRV